MSGKEELALGAVLCAAAIGVGELKRIIDGARQTAKDRRMQRKLNTPELSDWEKLEGIHAELRRRGVDAHLEHFGAISADDASGTTWYFGPEDGELHGNDQDGNSAATLPTAISADSIETFLKQGVRA